MEVMRRLGSNDLYKQHKQQQEDARCHSRTSRIDGILEDDTRGYCIEHNNSHLSNPFHYPAYQALHTVLHLRYLSNRYSCFGKVA